MSYAEKFDLIIILVVYKKKLAEISSLNFIKNIQAETDLKLHTIIYDNSPESINSGEGLPYNVSYIHNRNNPGLATAYNYALEFSLNHNCEWLLLLDHDTELTNDYFNKFCQLFKKNVLTSDIAVVMPIVEANKTVISPVKRDLRRYHLSLNQTGKLSGNISGVNSGTIVRVSFVKELGGFNLSFPLDFLDHWFFNEVKKASRYVYIMDTVIQHDLSLLNFKQNISPERYNSILKSQVLFYKDKGFLFSARFKFTLFKELFKHLVYTSNKQFALVIFKNLIESFK